jgi:AraC family transcriptional regulator
MTDNFINNKSKYLREEYFARINRVIDYIEENIDKEFVLADLARVANFSPFHFHRIFSAMVGETLFQFIQRIRLEKAAMQLYNNPKKSITEIALDCGFSSSTTFARSFKDTFQMSASQWRARGFLQKRKISNLDSNQSQLLGNPGKEFDVSSYYISDRKINKLRRNNMKSKLQIPAEITVKNLPELHVAYVRHIGPYKGDAELFTRLYEKLMRWAEPRDLVKIPETQFINVYHDDPEITQKEKLRLSVCMTVPENTPVDGEIGKMTVLGGKYVVGHFEIGADEFQAAWNTLCGSWLPDSGYQPADGPSYELCLNDPKDHPEGKYLVDICIPVKPL